MLNPNPLAPQIQALLDDGDLQPSTIVLDGIIMTAGGVVGPPSPTYGPNGWSLAASEIGGLQSQGAEALFAELAAARGVNAIIGTKLKSKAQYVISRFYAPPCAYGFAIQDGRFNTPPSFAPLTTPQFEQTKFNGVEFNNELFGIAREGSEASDSIRDRYRGEPGTTPFAVIDKAKDFDPNAAGWAANGMDFFDWAWLDRLGGFAGASYITYGRPDPSKHITGHNVCDAFFDTQTDASWTRYLRACARAMGATIPA